MTISSGALTGQWLGDYQLQSIVGVGGMAEVYQARDAVINRAVAVKALPLALAADPNYVERILEAQAAGLKERGGLDLSECFIDGTFTAAKQGEDVWVRGMRGKGTKLMAVADRFGLPLAVCAASASPPLTLIALPSAPDSPLNCSSALQIPLTRQDSLSEALYCDPVNRASTLPFHLYRRQHGAVEMDHRPCAVLTTVDLRGTQS